MIVWVAIHSHRYGTTAYVFDAEPTKQMVIWQIKKDGTEFEPELGESIDIIGPETVIILRPTQKN